MFLYQQTIKHEQIKRNIFIYQHNHNKIESHKK